MSKSRVVNRRGTVEWLPAGRDFRRSFGQSQVILDVWSGIPKLNAFRPSVAYGAPWREYMHIVGRAGAVCIGLACRGQPGVLFAQDATGAIFVIPDARNCC